MAPAIPQQQPAAERRRQRQAEALDSQRGPVGAEAEIGRVAEGGHAAGRHQALQAGREEHEDQDLGADGDPVVARHQRQQGHSEDDDPHPQALARAERRPGPERDRPGHPGRRLHPAEQPVGTDDQHDGHDHEDEHQRHRRQHQDPERVEFGYDQRRHEGPADAAEAADDHHDEGLDDDRQVHRVGYGITRDLQRAAEGREEDAEGENAGKQPFLVDAERRHHLAVLRGGPHEDAEPGAVEQQIDQAEDERAEPDEEQIVGRDHLAEDVDRALQARRPRADEVVRPPDDDGEVLDDQRHAERGEQLEQVGRAVDAAQQRHLDQRADQRHDQRSAHETAPEAERAVEPLGQRVGHIGAEHVEGAVGEVHDAGDAEDDRQPAGDEEQRRRAGEAGQELGEEEAQS